MRPLPLFAALAVVAAAAVAFALWPRAEEPKPLPPWRFPERPQAPKPDPRPEQPPSIADLRDPLPKGESRCSEGRRKRLYVFHGDELVLDVSAADALQLPGSVAVAEGRHDGDRGLPLAALLAARADTKVVEVWPCKGAPRRFSASELQAEPGRRLLVLANRGFFKLVDMGAGTQAGRLKHIAAVRLD